MLRHVPIVIFIRASDYHPQTSGDGVVVRVDIIMINYDLITRHKLYKLVDLYDDFAHRFSWKKKPASVNASFFPHKANPRFVYTTLYILCLLVQYAVIQMSITLRVPT